MSYLITFIIIAVIFYFLLKSRGMLPAWFLGGKKFYPPKGKATMFEVRSLIIRGEKERAIRLYCEIFHVPHKEGEKAVDELERSIQHKNPGI